MAPDKPKENSGKPIKIAIDKIGPRSLNCNQLDDETYRGLVEDIKSNGLRYTILIRQVGLDSFEIVDGEHRWRAAKELGQKEIECQVLEMGEEEAKITNFELNLRRGHLNPYKVALLFESEKVNGLSQAEIGKKYKITQARVSQYLEILTYPDEIQRLIISQLIKSEHARKIMSMLEDPELQAQVAKKVVDEGLSVRETEVAIRALLERKQKEGDWERRKEELFEILHFSLVCGTWKSENCNHRDKEGWCRDWSWPNEPIDLKAKCAWLEMREIKGMWYAKASSNVCALCVSFSQKGGELDKLQVAIKQLEQSFKEKNEVMYRIEENIGKLTRIPIWNLYDNFVCSQCGANHLIAVRFKCTKCGREDWWGYHPKSS